MTLFWPLLSNLDHVIQYWRTNLNIIRAELHCKAFLGKCDSPVTRYSHTIFLLALYLAILAPSLLKDKGTLFSRKKGGILSNKVGSARLLPPCCAIALFCSQFLEVMTTIFDGMNAIALGGKEKNDWALKRRRSTWSKTFGVMQSREAAYVWQICLPGKIICTSQQTEKW